VERVWIEIDDEMYNLDMFSKIYCGSGEAYERDYYIYFLTREKNEFRASFDTIEERDDEFKRINAILECY
jgi:hypothetical protein